MRLLIWIIFILTMDWASQFVNLYFGWEPSGNGILPEVIVTFMVIFFILDIIDALGDK